MEINATPHTTSQQHRDSALTLLRGVADREGPVTTDQMLAVVSIRAQLAIYEGLFELFGDGSLQQDAARILAHGLDRNCCRSCGFTE